MRELRNSMVVGGAVIIALALAACGPIYGQLMRVAEGVKHFEVKSGKSGDLKGGGALLVYAPFCKTEQAFFICPGELEEQMAVALTKAGLFTAESYLEHDPATAAAARTAMKSQTPEALQQAFKLAKAPERLLLGTLLRREMTVAPTRGVIMTEAYRLEFYNLRTGAVTVIEVEVRDLAEDIMTTLSDELVAQLAKG
ncbi:MAG: hypothetical protein A2091_10870 [Desulfuromonadales bacterium GWD2_61_12]|nr:MAG: hypothetical protein A2005_08195 [Desulfuromonadales bacterium GWC2_61_20]OGR32036.1 MAG: hypothetical protein A2091_10870 [Desulfuromonadales bacterium GWD2_61_12]HBT83119.1 hypothetical protein [Desulfuromonas sp.]